jgi:hypothetical protein
MSLLKHQLILYSDIAGQFNTQRSTTPYQKKLGFSRNSRMASSLLNISSSHRGR